MTQRQRAFDLSPTFLKDGQAERFVYVPHVGQDAILEKTVQGVRMRMPQQCDASALPFIGSDLLIPQGATEPEAHYREALQKAHEAWQVAGNDWSVLRWSLHVLLDVRPKARIVATRFDTVDGTFFPYPPALEQSKWATYEEDADADHNQPTRQVVAPGNWDWDTLNTCHGSWSWARMWLIIYAVSPTDWAHPADFVLGDAGAPALGDPSWSIGFREPSNLFAGIFSQSVLWKARHAQLVNILVSFDAGLFDPDADADGTTNPDGNYGRWSKMSGNDQVLARIIPNVRYCGRIDS